MNATQTQKEMAKAIGCSPYHLNAILCRRVRPSVDLAKRIEAETGTPWQSWFETPEPPLTEVPPPATPEY